MAGRQKKLNRKTIRLIADAIGIGANKEIAARYARVSVSGLMHWLQIAREEERNIENGAEPNPDCRMHIELLHAMDDAEGDLAVECLQVVQKARNNSETFWAWKTLETKYRKDFGRQEAPNLNIDITKLNDDQLRRIINGEDPITVLADTSASSAGGTGDAAASGETTGPA